jgi:predicted nucleotidyltransferase
VLRETGNRLVVNAADVRAALADILPAEPAIVAAYLFGSVARGTAGPMSDVDVGLLIGESSDGDAVTGRVTDALCRRLGTSRVDVVSLARVAMPVRYRVVRDGVLVACRDAKIVERFVVETVLHYLDFQPLRVRAFARVRQAVLETS